VVRNLRLFSIAAAIILVVNIVVISTSGVNAAQRGGNDLCVAVSGGTISNETVLDVVADGGTAISDSSGGTGNLAVTADSGDRDNNRNRNNNNNNNNNNRNNNNNNRNRNNWTSQSLQSLEETLFQQDTASAGNAGVSTASADGGAVSIGDINSGGNAGNAITVGDTVCPGAAPVAAAGGDKGGGSAGGGNAGGGRGGNVTRLPSTGVGEVEVGTSGSLALALGALGMAALALGFRDDRRFFRIGVR
jgi:hypothetical protein